MTDAGGRDTVCQHNNVNVNPNCPQCFPGLGSLSNFPLNGKGWASSFAPSIPTKATLYRTMTADLIELPVLLCSKEGREIQPVQVIRCNNDDLLRDIRRMLTESKQSNTKLPQKFSFMKQVGNRILVLSQDQEGGSKGYKAKHFNSPLQKHQLRICDDEEQNESAAYPNRGKMVREDSAGVIEFCVRHMMANDNLVDSSQSPTTLGMIRLPQDASMSEIRTEIAQQLPNAPIKTGRFVRMLQGDVTSITLEQESDSCKNRLYAYHFAPPYTERAELILLTSKTYVEGEVVQDETKNRELKSLGEPFHRQGKNPRDVVKDKASIYINAFLNSSGGILIFGANDDGVIERVPISGKRDDVTLSLEERVKLARAAKDDIRKLIDGKARDMDPVVDDDLVTTQFIPVRRRDHDPSTLADQSVEAEDEIFCAIELHVKQGRRSVYFMDKNSFDAYERRDGSTFRMEKSTITHTLHAHKPNQGRDTSSNALNASWHGGWRQLKTIFDFDALMRRLADPWAGREWLFAAVRRSLFEIMQMDNDRTEEDYCGIGLCASRGMGKTSFLSELALRPRHVSGMEVVAHHLCRADDPDTLNPSLFVHSIAAMLSQNCKDYRSLMVESSVDNGSDAIGESMLRALHLDHCESNPDDAFWRGVIEPLRFIQSQRDQRKQSHHTSLPVVIIVDALDECLAVSPESRIGRSGSATVAHLLERAFSQAQRLPSWIKFIVSYRPETLDIHGPLGRLSRHLWVLNLDSADHDTQLTQQAQDDIRMFIEAYGERYEMTSPEGNNGSGSWNFVMAAEFANRLVRESGRYVVEWDYEAQPGQWIPFEDMQVIDFRHSRTINANSCLYCKGRDTFAVNFDEGKQTSLKTGVEQRIRMVQVTPTGERVPLQPEDDARTKRSQSIDNEENVLDIFAANSNGNYLYARTVLEDVRSGRLRWDEVVSLPRGLDHLYDSFFKRYQKAGAIAPSVRMVLPVLEVLLAASKSGVTERDIVHAVVSGGACDPSAVAFCLRDIQWALDIDSSGNRVRYHLRHESIRSFLKNSTVTNDFKFCREENGHMLLAASLMQRCWPQQRNLTRWLQNNRNHGSSSFSGMIQGSSEDWYNWSDWVPNAEDGDVYSLAFHLTRSKAGSKEERAALLKSIGKELIDSVAKRKGTALHGAAFSGDVAVVKILLAAGASPNIDVRGRCPIHYASSKGFSTTVSLLLAAGANVGVKSTRGRTPLICAATRGSKATVKVLLNSMKESHQQGEMDLEELQSMLDSSLEDNGRTSLSVAAEEGHDEVIAMLIDAGASVTLVDTLGRTPLYYAARFGRVSKASIWKLLDARGGKDALDWGDGTRGQSALHVAVFFGHIDIVQALLERDANPDQTDNDGKSPLHDAASLGQYGNQMAKKKARTSSHATEDRRFDILNLLLKYSRGSLDAGDDYGCTPLWYAVAGGWTNSARILINHGVSVEPGKLLSVPNKARRGPASPLLLAIKRRHYETAAFLLDQGAVLGPAAAELDVICDAPGMPPDLATALRESASKNAA